MSNNITNAAQRKQIRDTSLVSIGTHNVEEILKGIIGHVVLWCSGAATWLDDKFNRNSNKQRMEQLEHVRISAKTTQEKLGEVLKWMDELTITPGELIRIFEAFKKGYNGSTRIKWTYDKKTLDKFVEDRELCETWFRKVRAAEESVDNHHLSLTFAGVRLNNWREKTVGLLEQIIQTRNRVLHHNTHRPCLRLFDGEWESFVKWYTLLVDSGLLSIFNDDDTKREYYLKFIEILEKEEAIPENNMRLTKQVEDLKTERNAANKRSEQMEAERDVAVERNNQLERERNTANKRSEQMEAERDVAVKSNNQLERERNTANERSVSLERKLQQMEAEKDVAVEQKNELERSNLHRADIMDEFKEALALVTHARSMEAYWKSKYARCMSEPDPWMRGYVHTVSQYYHRELKAAKRETGRREHILFSIIDDRQLEIDNLLPAVSAAGTGEGWTGGEEAKLRNVMETMNGASIFEIAAHFKGISESRKPFNTIRQKILEEFRTDLNDLPH